MFVLSFLVLSALNDDSSLRPLLFVLLVLAILLLLAGASIAIVALRNQQKKGSQSVTLEQLENDVV